MKDVDLTPHSLRYCSCRVLSVSASYGRQRRVLWVGGDFFSGVMRRVDVCKAMTCTRPDLIPLGRYNWHVARSHLTRVEADRSGAGRGGGERVFMSRASVMC